MASRQLIFFHSAGAITKPTTNRAWYARNQKYTPVGFLLKNTDCVGVLALSIGSRAGRAYVCRHMRVRRQQRRVAVGSPRTNVDGGVTDGLACRWLVAVVTIAAVGRRLRRCQR